MENSGTELDQNNRRARCAAYKGYKDGSVDFLGEQITMLSGYSKGEFGAKNLKWTDLIWEEDKKVFKAAFVQALKTDKTYMREYRIRDKNGKVLWIQEWGQIVIDENGEMDYVTGILMEITAQKEAEIASRKSEEKTGRYLIFTMAGQKFGLNVKKIKHIIQVMPIIPILQAPAFVKGVINLRDQIIPIVDLGLKLGREDARFTECSCIIIADIDTPDKTLAVGLVVDSVSDVRYLKGSDIEDAPPFISGFKTDYLLGIAKIDKEIMIILDIDLALSDINIDSL
jgi:PAS domain S-box-containing protein